MFDGRPRDRARVRLNSRSSPNRRLTENWRPRYRVSKTKRTISDTVVGRRSRRSGPSASSSGGAASTKLGRQLLLLLRSKADSLSLSLCEAGGVHCEEAGAVRGLGRGSAQGLAGGREQRERRRRRRLLRDQGGERGAGQVVVRAPGPLAASKWPIPS